MPANRDTALPAEAQPVLPKELSDALALIAAADPYFPQPGQPGYYIPIGNPQAGQPDRLYLSSSGFGLVVNALGPHYQFIEAGYFLSLCWRAYALLRLVQSGLLEDHLIPDGPGQILIPDEVIEAAADFPLAGQEGFDPRLFLAALRRADQQRPNGV